MKARWIRLAAALVVAASLTVPSLAQSFEEGWAAYERGDYRIAMENFLPLARNGDAASQFGMGVLYNSGAGVKQDRDEGLRWSQLAAQQGHVGGLINVAKAYTNGWGVSPDQAMANRYFGLAADRGDASAQFTLASRYRDGVGVAADPKEAARRFSIVVRQGSSSFVAEARRQLQLLQNRTVEHGVAAWKSGDYATAIDILSPFANDGDGDAQFYLGQAYQFGSGVKRDFGEAARWFRLAAKRDLPGAQYALGKLLEAGGPGLERDDREAVLWLTRAAQLGMRAATYDLGIHYRDGVGVKRDLTEAQRLFEMAVAGAPKGDTAAAQARLAIAALETDGRRKQATAKAPVIEEPVIEEPAPVVEVAAVAPKAPLLTVSGPAQVMPDCQGADMPAVRSEQKRVALVVGLAAYQNVTPLRNATCDARAIAATLEKAGFEVVSAFDLDRSALELKVRDFVRLADKADVSLFYYSGHGLQVDGVNYMVPIDAKVEDATALSFELIDIDAVTRYMSGQKKVGIVLLDACRDNPFAAKLERSLKRVSRSANLGRGLAPIAGQGGGLVIGFATSPGDVASDGDGDHSPFTTALLETLPSTGVEFELVMKRVKARVVELTEREPTPQRPWTNSDLTTEFYLIPAS